VTITHIQGKDKGKVMLYALSTCGWCKKAKALLAKLKVAYDYIFIDMLEGKERNIVYEEMQKYNPRGSFPTIVINDNIIIAGFDEEKILKELGE